MEYTLVLGDAWKHPCLRKIVRKLSVLLLAVIAFLQAAPLMAQSPETQLGQALMQQMPGAAPGAAPAAAGEGWYICEVKRVGPGWGNIYLDLECLPTITARWFVARTDQARDMLASGLSAVTAGKSMHVYLTGTAAYSEIRASYVIK